MRSYVYAVDQDGQDWEIEVQVEYDAVYEPAYTTGLPENCYPDSSEMTITEVVSTHDLPSGITDEMVTAAAEKDAERLAQECWEDFMEPA